MRRSLYIVLLALSPFAINLSPLRAQDYARLSERTIMGTARYVGMGGAMSAIGGDPSAVFDNPAGLGLYRRTEVMLSFDQTFDHVRQQGSTVTDSRRFFMVPQASLILSVPSYNNFMFSFRRLHTFNRSMRGVGVNAPSLGAQLANLAVAWDIPFCADPNATAYDLIVDESGYVNEFTVDWAINVSDRWYVGAGLHVQSYHLRSDGDYIELFDDHRDIYGTSYYNRNLSTLSMSGVTCSFAVGVLYRPTSWLRLGFGLNSPSVGALNTYTNGSLKAQTDSLRTSIPPEQSGRDGNFHMPLHLSSSVAFQAGGYGMLALQYDYFKQGKEDGVHSLRAGLEVIPVLGLYVNAGYVFESTFNRTTKAVPMDASFNRQDTYSIAPLWSQYASIAVGYRGAYLMLQAAYQYRWQRFNLYAHEGIVNPCDMNADTHRIVVTLGWHRH